MLINWEEFIRDLPTDNALALEDMPEIDLYMDQVIQLFDKKFAGFKRDNNEKVLTKTMINNYAKGKLFFPVNDKRYSKDHLMLISLIYQLKGALSINDIKQLLDRLNVKTADEGFQLEDVYASYLHLIENNANRFKEDVTEAADDVEAAGTQFDSDSDQAYLKDLLMAAALINMSNLYRRAAEDLIDNMSNGEEEST